jgi:hypothetical protein
MAGARPRIEVQGERQLRRALAAMGDDLEDLRDLHADLADMIAEEARDEAPVVTGELRDSIRGSRTKARATVYAGGRRVPYAGPVHFGWPGRGISPQPFLYDAIDRRRDAVIARYREGIDAIIRKTDARMPK